MKIELKKGDKYVTQYMVFECPKGSGVFTPAYKPGTLSTAHFSKHENAEAFCKSVMTTKRGWHNGVPNAVPMDWIIRAIRLPARVKERAAAAKAYRKHCQ
jgi:hypothetical protein